MGLRFILLSVLEGWRSCQFLGFFLLAQTVIDPLDAFHLGLHLIFIRVGRVTRWELLVDALDDHLGGRCVSRIFVDDGVVDRLAVAFVSEIMESLADTSQQELWSRTCV